jgi:hypothetical protein
MNKEPCSTTGFQLMMEALACQYFASRRSLTPCDQGITGNTASKKPLF